MRRRAGFYIKTPTRVAKGANIRRYFRGRSIGLRPWLHELAERYKQCGVLPQEPAFILPSYYSDQKDKFIAVVAGLLTVGDEFEHIQQVRELIGRNPWEWFVSRSFVSLSMWGKRGKKTGGTRNKVLAEAFDVLWDYKDISVTELVVKQLAFAFGDMFGEKEFLYNLRLVRLIFELDETFPKEWSESFPDLCPINDDVLMFLETFFPDYKKGGGVDKCIGAFGFERDYDFFFAYLGYKELQKRNPSGCSLLATTYQRWYESGRVIAPRDWPPILPEIEF